VQAPRRKVGGCAGKGARAAWGGWAMPTPAGYINLSAELLSWHWDRRVGSGDALQAAAVPAEDKAIWEGAAARARPTPMWVGLESRATVLSHKPRPFPTA
jgi:hypothetical protein